MIRTTAIAASLLGTVVLGGSAYLADEEPALARSTAAPVRGPLRHEPQPVHVAGIEEAVLHAAAAARRPAHFLSLGVYALDAPARTRAGTVDLCGRPGQEGDRVHLRCHAGRTSDPAEAEARFEEMVRALAPKVAAKGFVVDRAGTLSWRAADRATGRIVEVSASRPSEDWPFQLTAELSAPLRPDAPPRLAAER